VPSTYRRLPLSLVDVSSTVGATRLTASAGAYTDYFVLVDDESRFVRVVICLTPLRSGESTQPFAECGFQWRAKGKAHARS